MLEFNLFYTHRFKRNLSSCLFPSPDYLQVSSLEWQPSVWEVSSFLVLMSKPAACCWKLAERGPEAGTVPPARLSRKRVPWEQPCGPPPQAPMCEDGDLGDLENVFPAVVWLARSQGTQATAVLSTLSSVPRIKPCVDAESRLLGAFI